MKAKLNILEGFNNEKLLKKKKNVIQIRICVDRGLETVLIIWSDLLELEQLSRK